MRGIRSALVAVFVSLGAFGAMAGSASAIVIAQDGHWCGIDSPQRLPKLNEYLHNHEGQKHHYGTCDGAYTHVFNPYKTKSSKIVRFQIHQRKFLKEMFVGREKWIGSADIGKGTMFRASENGHDVHGTFLGDFEAEGSVTLEGQTGHFYAVWVSS